MQKRKQRYHTPTTFRATRRLQFTNSPTTSTMSTIHPPPPGVSPPRTTPGISPAANNVPTLQHSLPAIKAFQLQPQYILPWDIPGSKTTTLFKVKPPHLSYPAGSSDEVENKRFTKRMDMFLFSNFQVRSILVGDRPHPFSGYERLSQYWIHQGQGDWVFDTTKTFAMMQEIFDNGHTHFHQELYELLWFGGVLSYGNIMRETYAILYAWIKPQDLPDVDGLCEVDDGVSFRKVIISSLRLVRTNHTQELISREYAKLEKATIIM